MNTPLWLANIIRSLASFTWQYKSLEILSLSRPARIINNTINMHFQSSIVAALGMASYASAHIMMTTPKPFGKSTLNNSPLEKDGSDFPCKQRGGVYDPEGASNPMALGSTQPLNFVGSAVHGGGSCQISITYDEKPTKDSVWKVIHSIEGGCPMRNTAGNAAGGPDTPVPDQIGRAHV